MNGVGYVMVTCAYRLQHRWLWGFQKIVTNPQLPTAKTPEKKTPLTLVNLILVTEINLLSAYLSKGMEMAVGDTFPALIERPTSHLFSWPSHSHRNIAFSAHCMSFTPLPLTSPREISTKSQKTPCISACGGWSSAL